MAVHGKRVRVQILAPNVTAEVYITHAKAKEMAEHILLSLKRRASGGTATPGHHPQPPQTYESDTTFSGWGTATPEPDA